MKRVFILAALLLLCTAAVYAVDSEADAVVSSEVQTTLESMVLVSDSHAIVSSMQEEASAGGVKRLVELVTKVLRRLQRQAKRRVIRHKRHMQGCKRAIRRDKAIIRRARGNRRAKLVKLGIAKNSVTTSKNDAARLQRKAADHAQAAAKLDNQQLTRRNEYETSVARLKQSNVELEALIKLLKRIDAKLTRNGLAEIASELSALIESSSSAHAEMLQMIAERIESKQAEGTASDVQDVHDMIALLIKQLQAEIKGNVDNLKAQEKNFASLRQSLIEQANAERKNAKTALEQRDAAIKAGDAAAKLQMQLQSEIEATAANIKATKKHLAATKQRCRAERRAFKPAMASLKKQIRVLKSVLRALENHKTSAEVTRMLQGIDLTLPVWEKGVWSKCSTKCGVGKQTRKVTCSAPAGGRCLGNKPRTTRMCNLGPCKADCIVSAWSRWSECSALCGGGVKRRTRKVLAVAANGGKACPSALGLVQKKGCNPQECTGKEKRKLKRRLGRINWRLRRLRDKKNRLKDKLNKLGDALAGAESEAEFLQLVEQAKQVAAVRDGVKEAIGDQQTVKFDTKQDLWELSAPGKQAVAFCSAQAPRGSNAWEGCVQDMRLTGGDTSMAGRSAKATVMVCNLAKTNAILGKVAIRTGGNAPSRTCTSVGDPHTTSFQGDYFHIQVPGIYTFAKSDDGFFEVQMKQDGSSGAGSPSYVRSCKIRFDGQVYDNVLNRDGFVVNCLRSQLTITVPGAYQNHMEGICGRNSISRGAHNFALPGGKEADVSYGKHRWDIGGYGGRSTKLSKWALAWRPSMENCMYSRDECRANLREGTEAKRVVNTPWGRVDFAHL